MGSEDELFKKLRKADYEQALRVFKDRHSLDDVEKTGWERHEFIKTALKRAGLTGKKRED